MRLIAKMAVVAAASLLGLESQAQKIKVIEGDLSVLKNETTVNVDFDYSGMRVGKFEKEEDYIAEKKAAYDKKEPGRGASWEKAWVADRKNTFEPKFIELFEEQSNYSVAKTPAKYTLIFKTIFTEPGYNIYISRKNAEIDGEVWVVETADKSKVLAKVSVQNCAGRTYGGYDYESGVRIGESYAVAGKYFGKFLKKELK